MVDYPCFFSPLSSSFTKFGMTHEYPGRGCRYCTRSGSGQWSRLLTDGLLQGGTDVGKHQDGSQAKEQDSQQEKGIPPTTKRPVGRQPVHVDSCVCSQWRRRSFVLLYSTVILL